MRFACGKAAAVRAAKKLEWHRWFAWRPVRVGQHDCRWLEYVERKGRILCGPDGCYWFFDFRASLKGDRDA